MVLKNANVKKIVEYRSMEKFLLNIEGLKNFAEYRNGNLHFCFALSKSMNIHPKYFIVMIICCVNCWSLFGQFLINFCSYCVFLIKSVFVLKFFFSFLIQKLKLRLQRLKVLDKFWIRIFLNGYRFFSA